jgi:hypothetical protein
VALVNGGVEKNRAACLRVIREQQPRGQQQSRPTPSQPIPPPPPTHPSPHPTQPTWCAIDVMPASISRTASFSAASAPISRRRSASSASVWRDTRRSLPSTRSFSAARFSTCCCSCACMPLAACATACSAATWRTRSPRRGRPWPPAAADAANDGSAGLWVRLTPPAAATAAAATAAAPPDDVLGVEPDGGATPSGAPPAAACCARAASRTSTTSISSWRIVPSASRYDMRVDLRRGGEAVGGSRAVKLVCVGWGYR